MALTTQVNSLKECAKEKGKREKLYSEELHPRCNKVSRPSIVENGEMIWWFDNHRNPSKFLEGLWMTQTPNDHHIWQKAKDELNKKHRKPNGEKPKQKLKSQDTLKSVLMTTHALPE